MFAMLPVAAAAQDQPKPLELNSCIRFAADFFKWYVPLTQGRVDEAPFRLAIEQKSEAFSPTLLKALRNDAQAQAEAKGEIVGIDFDPFVGSQDPANHYSVRNAIQKSNTCTVEVWRDSGLNAERPQSADAIAELAFSTGWRFTNFKYPDVNADLLQTLALLRRQRNKP